MTRKEKIVVGLLALLNFTHILDFMIMMPLGNIMMPLWDLSTSEFALLVSGYSIAAFFSSFAAIFFADRFDRKRLLLFAYLGFLAGTFGCSITFGFSSMLVMRVVTGIFGGLMGAQVLSIIGDFIPYERRGRAMGLLMAGFGLASVIGVPVGLFLANTFDWYFPFIVIAAVGSILYPLLWKHLPNVDGHLVEKVVLKERIQGFFHIFQNKTQVTALLFNSLLIMGHFVIIPLINPYMVYNVGIAPESTPLIYLCGGISSLVMAQVVGVLSDRFGKRQVFVIAAVSSLFLIYIITNMQVSSLTFVLVIFSFWFSAATARTVPGQAMTTQAVSNKSRGSFMSLQSSLQSLGSGMAAMISGWVTFSDASFKIYNYPILGYLSICTVIVCIFLSYRLDRLIKIS